MSDKPPKKEPSDKMKELIKAREEARAQLTAALGKGARVANAASFASKPAAQRNLAAFVEQIKRRNAAAAEVKTAAKEAGKKVEVVKKEVKNLVKTAKKNVKKAASASKAAAAASANSKAKTKGKTKKVKYFKFPYDSVEREAKKLAKKAEELQAKLTSVGVELKDVCKLCKDFQEETPKKA
jgi:chromosome segregation ATPase